MEHEPELELEQEREQELEQELEHELELEHEQEQELEQEREHELEQEHEREQEFMTNIKKLTDAIAGMTPKEWTYSTCYGVATIETKDGEPIAHAVEYLKSKDADGIVLLRNVADELVAVCEAAKRVVGVLDIQTLPGRGLDMFANLGEQAVYLEDALAQLEKKLGEL